MINSFQNGKHKILILNSQHCTRIFYIFMHFSFSFSKLSLRNFLGTFNGISRNCAIAAENASSHFWLNIFSDIFYPKRSIYFKEEKLPSPGRDSNSDGWSYMAGALTPIDNHTCLLICGSNRYFIN